MNYIRICTLLYLAVLLLSCRGDEPKRIPDTLPDIIGSVITISQPATQDQKEPLQLLVKADDEQATNYSQASVTVNKNTLIESKDGKHLKAGALQEGQLIEVWFEDEVMESMPVQARAKAIRINLQP
ncbi:DUF3221 domain-containing protein [Pontibacter burrus]|uniref:DUF3221 domain-containing protein n=1 Tax=Pontibacter burrus TaxID=2704466 RepID=A0A6B3LX13_9BACT|nr:DUF3221 domain-containing protein [Pontibacter burrus]NEM98150.1 DUF3221 domain-containing protein [Pontibacter burrus]